VTEDSLCRACKVNPCSPGSVSCDDCFGKHRTFEDLTIRELHSAVEFLSAMDRSAVLQSLVGYGFGPLGSREHTKLEALIGKPAARLIYESIRAAIRKPEYNSGMREYSLRAIATH